MPADPLTKLSQKRAAWLLGTTDRTLRNWPEAPRNRDHTYNAAELVRWYISRVEQDAERETIPSDQLERGRKAKADLLELELAQKRGQLIERSEVVRIFGLVRVQLQAAVDAMQANENEEGVLALAEALAGVERVAKTESVET